MAQIDGFCESIYLAVLILITENPYKSQNPSIWAIFQDPDLTQKT